MEKKLQEIQELLKPEQIKSKITGNEIVALLRKSFQYAYGDGSILPEADRIKEVTNLLQDLIVDLKTKIKTVEDLQVWIFFFFFFFLTLNFFFIFFFFFFWKKKTI